MENLKVIANVMLPVLENENGDKFVNARELHEKLKINTRFNDWINRMVANYGFEDGSDFYSFLSKTTGRPSREYVLSIDTAKELAMVQNNEGGRAIRKYFIEVEKQARKLASNPVFSYMIDDPITRAQKWIEEQEEKKQALEVIEQQKPKVLFAESVGESENTILIRDLAKLIKQNGVDIGEKRLFEWLREHGYLIKQKGTDHNRPTQKSMELGLFKIKETPINRSTGIQVSITSKVTGKGQLYFVNKFLNEKQSIS
ncbi:phage antirepressor KilAC domain-containing protein [Listeria booriae]|uniref:phage antirepressor KilAC domain-containing protein n=1 Tax=Listeria booriae TaxID=1552123 RepID=UPI001624D851|nr:phage antirepressor KilAC domain-containing protein [Listeria booriae]MBC1290584.1 phage antirepressor Ant [Listeria booriae]